MTDAGPALHLVFNLSAAASLRQALAEAGRDERVIGLADDLSFGPIASQNPATRIRWIGAELGLEWDDIGAQSEAFWREAAAWEGERVIWTSRGSTQDALGALEALRRLEGAPCRLIDVSALGVGAVAPYREPRVALLAPRVLRETRMFEAGDILAEARRAERMAIWERLRRENAPLRVFDNRLFIRSAPIDYFDQRLLDETSSAWTPAARVVVETLERQRVLETSDLFLFARLIALVEARRLAHRGDLSSLRTFEVRRPAA